MYLQPIKNDDPNLDFYTMYRRETMEYDTQYMEKYNEDLNTTLIFVRVFLLSLSHHSVDDVLRLVCSLRSAQPSSSTSSPSFSQTPPNGLKPISVQFYSASTDPFLPAKTPSLPQRGMALPRKSSQPRTSYTQVC